MAVNLVQNADGSVRFQLDPASTELGRLGGPTTPTATSPVYRPAQYAVVPLTAADTAGGVLAWANPTGTAIVVDEVVVRVTTQSGGACTVDFGVAANGTTLNDTLIDGLSVAATGIFNNIDDKGTNGKSRQNVSATQYVTGSVASGASSGLVGFAYIRYFIA